MAYTKYHSSWSATDLLSGAAFNCIETQYDDAKTDADIHTHDTRYYPKATADITFFSTSFYTGFDADMLDGNHLSDMVAAVMPIGAIMAWSGTDANVPSGWAICNGGSGTPDLRNKFVVGAGDTYSIGDIGGALTTRIAGSVTVGSHIITADEMPLHTHTYTDRYNDVGYTYYVNGGASSATGSLTYANRTTGSAGSGGGHGHAGSSISMNDISTLPPYFALYYIMKVS